MELTVYIAKASDGYFLVQAIEMPELTVRAASFDEITDAVRAAAAAATGQPPDEFAITTDY